MPADDEYRDFAHKMMRGIVGFEIAISSIEGKAKLSQNRPEGDRAAVIERLRRSDDPGQRALAERMAALG